MAARDMWKRGGWWLYVHVTSTEEKKLYEEQKQQS